MSLKYTKDHEWIKIDGNIATIGITKHASESLGELVYVELPEVESNVSKGDSFVVVESSKSASDVYAPVSGKVIEVNDSLDSDPQNVNNSPYDEGWLVKIEFSSLEELDDCMDESAYKKLLQEE
jgi:glycine cleavage system H protein